MRFSPLLVALLAVLWAGCSKKDGAVPKSTNESATGNPITAPVDYLGAVAKAKRVSEKTLDSVSINQAIQLFYAQEDRFPKDLKELADKHYIAAIPSTPTGMTWAYNPQTGEIKIVRKQ